MESWEVLEGPRPEEPQSATCSGCGTGRDLRFKVGERVMDKHARVIMGRITHAHVGAQFPYTVAVTQGTRFVDAVFGESELSYFVPSFVGPVPKE